MATSVSKSEKSYIQSSLHTSQALRADGRSLKDYRTIFLETGVAPLANGSARVNVGKSAHEGGGGTEVIAATKLEVEDVENGDGVDGGRVVCTVLWCVAFLSSWGRKPNCRAWKTVPLQRILISQRTLWTSCNTTTPKSCTK